MADMEHLTESAAAAHVGVAKRTIGYWVSTGRLKPIETFRDGGRTRRLYAAVDVEEVAAAMAERRYALPEVAP